MRTVPSIAGTLPVSLGERRDGLGTLWALLRPSRLLAPARILDVRTLPDHLKRDIGVLDGNDPRGARR